MNERVTGIVLAGGQSRRLGTDKRMLRLWGESGPTLLEHTVAIVAALCDQTLIIADQPALFAVAGAETLADEFPGAGPLGGIATGLAAASAPRALVVACDMPWLNRELLAAMLAAPFDADALVPRTGGVTRNIHGAEPLHAIYRRQCEPAARELLAQNQLRVAALLDRVSTSYFDPAALLGRPVDPRTFQSVNTPDDQTFAQRSFDTSTTQDNQ